MITKKMGFFRVWFTAYLHPLRAVEGLRDKPAPHWGLYGVLIRSALVSLGWYLPAYLLGRVPSSLPSLTLLPAGDYYLAAAIIFPIATVLFWLLDGALAHVVLRLMGHESNIDQILNIDGMGNLVVGPLVVAWDWVTLALWADGATVAWGISHLLIDAWYIVFVLTGLRRILNLPVWLAAALVLLWFAVTVPLAMLVFTA